MRILLIAEASQKTRQLQELLLPAGFVVQETETGDDGIGDAKASDYEAILLLLSAPGMKDVKFIRKLRDSKIKTPILAVSFDNAVDLRIDALRMGADDFMILPCNDEELIVRLHAAARRGREHYSSLIEAGDLSLDLETHTVTAAGSPMSLTAKEYQLLEALLLRKGAMLSKNALLDYLYGGLDEPDEKIIDVFVCKLRRKIADMTCGANYIQTVWGRGYQVTDPRPTKYVHSELAARHAIACPITKEMYDGSETLELAHA